MFFEDSEFLRGICILLKNFHALNKKIFSCNYDSCYKVPTVSEDLLVSLKEAENTNFKHVFDTNCLETLFEDVIDSLQEKSKGFEGFAFVFRLLMKNGKESIEGFALLGEVFLS